MNTYIGLDVEFGAFLEEEILELLNQSCDKSKKFQSKFKKAQLPVRVGIVDADQNTVYDKIVNPRIDGLSTYSIPREAGVTKQQIEEAARLEQELPEIREILRGKTIVGFGVEADLRSLLLSAEAQNVRDISKSEGIKSLARQNTGEECNSLRDIYWALTGYEIQCEEAHNPCEDALAPLHLYLLFDDMIEEEVKSNENFGIYGNKAGAVSINSSDPIDYLSQLNQRRNYELGNVNQKLKMGYSYMQLNSRSRYGSIKGYTRRYHY